MQEILNSIQLNQIIIATLFIAMLFAWVMYQFRQQLNVPRWMAQLPAGKLVVSLIYQIARKNRIRDASTNLLNIRANSSQRCEREQQRRRNNPETDSQIRELEAERLEEILQTTCLEIDTILEEALRRSRKYRVNQRASE